MHWGHDQAYDAPLSYVTNAMAGHREMMREFYAFFGGREPANTPASAAQSLTPALFDNLFGGKK